MNKYEKLSLIGSGLALVISILSPIANFYLFDPVKQSSRNYPKIIHSLESSDKGKRLSISNVSLTPMKGFEIIIIPLPEHFDELPNVRVEAPYFCTWKTQDNLWIGTFTQSMGKNDTLELVLPNGVASAFVFTEYGQSTYIPFLWVGGGGGFNGHGASVNWD